MAKKDKDKDKKEKKNKRKGMITRINNGAVRFLEEGETPFDELQSSDCNCKGREFCQIVHSGDTTPFQVSLSEASGTEISVNGSFTTDVSWTKGSGWTITGGKAVHTASGGGDLSQVVTVIGSTYYKITFTISDYSNSQNLSVVFAGDTVKTLNANGIYTVYWFTDATPSELLIKFTPHASTSLKIDNVSIKEMSTVVYGIKDLNEAVYKTVSDGTGVTYYQATASIEIDWSDINDGCYRLFIIDNGDNLFIDADTGSFEAVEGAWDLTLGTNIAVDRQTAAAHNGTYGCEVSITTGKPVTDLAFSGDTSITLEENKDYIITGWVKFTGAISDSSVGGSISNYQAVYLKPASYSMSQCYTVNAAFGESGNFGTYKFINGNYTSQTIIGNNTWMFISTYFNSGDNTSINIGVYLNGTFANFKNELDFFIDTIELRGPVDIESECFKKGEFECTKLLSWNNNENAYSFTYDGTTFQHEMRVKAKLWKPKYPKDKKEVFVDSAGNRRILTSRTKKEEILSLEEIPEYLHDAFSIGVEHDNFYIDGVKYINEETDYDPAWRNSSLLAPVIM